MNLETILQSLEKTLNSNIITLVIESIIIYIAVLWITVIIWVSKDANHRSNNIFFQVVAVLIVILLTPLFGLLIYLIIRPSKTLVEKYIEEVQMQMLNEEEKKEELEKCPQCHHFVHHDHKFCPYCGTKLKKICLGCNKMYSVLWNICPFCGKKEKMKHRPQTEKEEIVKEKEM